MVLLLFASTSLWAQTGGDPASASPSASATPTTSASATPDVQRRLADLRERLSEVEASLQAVPTPDVGPEQPGKPPTYYSSLLRMETCLRRLITLEESSSLLQTQLERVQAESAELTRQGLQEQRPYPVTLLDGLEYELVLAEEDLNAAKTSLSSAQAEAKVQAQQLEDRQAMRRRLLDQATLSKAPDLERERDIENANWAVRAMEVQVELSNAEVTLAEKGLLLAQNRRDLLERKVSLVRAQFQFTKAIFEAQLEKLEDERALLSAEHEKVQAEADTAIRRVKELASARTELELAERDAQTEWLTTYQRRKILLEQALELNLIKRDLWERRYSLSQGRAVTTLTDWQEAARGLLRRLDNDRENLENQLKQLRGRMANVVESAPAGDRPVESWKTSQAKALAAHQSALEAALAEVGQAKVLAERLMSEIKAARESLSPGERVARAWSMVVGVWRTELYTIGDSSVTVGKVIVAFLILLVGLSLTGRTTRFVSRRLLAHLPLTDAAQVNLERGFRYFFVLLIFLFALRVVNIPLTIFTFLGGTLAIAVGFGAQNILNNFISGLILMAERPIRVGDLIEVDSTTGVVEEIGARSTRIRMGTGIHVVLPNSVLLENKVVNWTLNDQMVRTSVSVGVAYGSDPRKVMELISRATLSLDTIERTPEHFVLLDDFAESSLKFTVHFWVSIVDPLNKRLSESNLRIAIASLFEENGISIPFPRRDLALEQPVAVRILEEPPIKKKAP